MIMLSIEFVIVLVQFKMIETLAVLIKLLGIYSMKLLINGSNNSA